MRRAWYQRGSSTLLTLVLLLVTLVILTALSQLIARQANTITNQEQEEQAFGAADGGVEYVKWLLASGQTPSDIAANPPQDKAVGTSAAFFLPAEHVVATDTSLSFRVVGDDGRSAPLCQLIDATLCQTSSGDWPAVQWQHHVSTRCTGGPAPTYLACPGQADAGGPATTPTPTPTPDTLRIDNYKHLAFDRGQGTIAVDSSTSDGSPDQDEVQHDSSLPNAALWSTDTAPIPGSNSHSIYLDGTLSFEADLATNILNEGPVGSDFGTVSFWFKTDPPGPTSFPSTILLRSQGVPHFNFVVTSRPLECAAGRDDIFHAHANRGDNFFGLNWLVEERASAGQWHHFAATKSGTTWRIWIDGQSTTVPFQPQSLSLGGRMFPGESFPDNLFGQYGGFRGWFDEYKLFRRVLSPAEIATLAQRAAGAPAPVPPHCS